MLTFQILQIVFYNALKTKRGLLMITQFTLRFHDTSLFSVYYILNFNFSQSLGNPLSGFWPEPSFAQRISVNACNRNAVCAKYLSATDL